MCRIAFLPRGTPLDHPDLLEHLDYLNRTMGGDGMGAATWRDDKPLLLKGVDVTPETLLAYMQKHGNETGWLIHARSASIGEKVGVLCQPYVEGGRHLVVHNGHWPDWVQLYWALIVAKKIKPGEYMNDSRTIARAVSVVGPEVLWCIPRGVFVVWTKGEPDPRLHLVEGSFEYSGLSGEAGGIVYASAYEAAWKVQDFSFYDRTEAVLTPRGPKIVYGKEPVPWGEKGRADACSYRKGSYGGVV